MVNRGHQNASANKSLENSSVASQNDQLSNNGMPIEFNPMETKRNTFQQKKHGHGTFGYYQDAQEGYQDSNQQRPMESSGKWGRGNGDQPFLGFPNYKGPRQF